MTGRLPVLSTSRAVNCFGRFDLEKVENPPSASVVVQNMSLAAWDAGVGAVWLSFGAAPPVRWVLGIEEGETVIALLAMGYPAEVPPAPPRDAFSDHLREVS